MSTMTISCPTTRYHGILAISDAVCWLGLDFVQNRVGNILWFIPLYLIYRDMPRIASRSVKVLLLTVFTWINPCIYRNPTITSIISSMGMAHNTRKSIFCHFPAKIHFRPFSTIFPRQPIFCHFLPFSALVFLATSMTMTRNTRKSISCHFWQMSSFLTWLLFSAIFHHLLPLPAWLPYCP